MANNLPWNIHSFHKEEKAFSDLSFLCIQMMTSLLGIFYPPTRKSSNQHHQGCTNRLMKLSNQMLVSMFEYCNISACVEYSTIWAVGVINLNQLHPGAAMAPLAMVVPRGLVKGNLGVNQEPLQTKSLIWAMFRQDRNPKIPKTMTWLCLRMGSIFSVPIPRLSLFLKIRPHIQQELPESGVSLGQKRTEKSKRRTRVELIIFSCP